MEILTKSARQTQKLGEKIANNLISGKFKPRIFCLHGDLGSGKTTFIAGFAKGLGIKKRILSPTFIMIRQYVIGDTQDVKRRKKFISHITSHISRLYHVDLYRVKNEKDVLGLGLSEIWSNPENVVAIEWAEKIEKILPQKRIEIHFEYIGENERKIKING